MALWEIAAVAVTYIWCSMSERQWKQRCCCDSSELFNIYAETWLISLSLSRSAGLNLLLLCPSLATLTLPASTYSRFACLPPFPYSLSCSLPFPYSMLSASSSPLCGCCCCLPNIFCIELFQANLRLFALPIWSRQRRQQRCCSAAGIFFFNFFLFFGLPLALSLAFAAILGLFMFCLAASCWGRMRPVRRTVRASVCVWSRCVYCCSP